MNEVEAHRAAAIAEVVRVTSNLIEIDPYISINDILAEHNVIPSIRQPRPTPEEIEAAGYRHDGEGSIIGKSGKILKGSSNGKNRPKWYKISNIHVKGYGSLTTGLWSVPTHILIFALVHKRWPRDGYVIDHIDDNQFNNHPDNLREITYYENNYIVKLTEKDLGVTKTNGNGIQTNLLNFFN